MKATELKIDNLLLLDDNKIVRVLWFKLEIACIMELGVEYPSAIVSLDRLKPIPLTEEWLLKFGFTKIDREDEDFTYFKKGNIEFTDVSPNGFELVWYELSPCISIHQLQNLYFALTGEELK